MKFETMRPSCGSMRGPYVLKMRAMPTSTRCLRAKSIVSDSAQRFPSS
jgi:hypothetical protein